MNTNGDAGFTLHGKVPLYRQLAVLDVERHGTAAFLPSEQPYAFAASDPLVAITLDEFERAALDYPIIFFGAEREAVIVAGLEAKRNLFVGPDGRYAPGAYVPAYLRRHPFMLARGDDARDRIVCIDEASARLVPLGTPGADPLFERGQPSERTREAIGFCRAVDEAEARTRAFVAMLDERGLLEPRHAFYEPPGAPPGTRKLVVEYDAVSRARLEALPAAEFAALRADGVLSAIYAHLLSTANWEVLPLWAGG